jgi:hypothetical protein
MVKSRMIEAAVVEPATAIEMAVSPQADEAQQKLSRHQRAADRCTIDVEKFHANHLRWLELGEVQ